MATACRRVVNSCIIGQWTAFLTLVVQMDDSFGQPDLNRSSTVGAREKTGQFGLTLRARDLAPHKHHRRCTLLLSGHV